MCRLLEAIKVKNRILQNIEYHNERLNRTRHKLFGKKDFIDLGEIIKIPEDLPPGIFKCRIVYDIEILSIEFQLYNPKPIRRLKIVECNDIDYEYKYADRTLLNKLLKEKGNADDILIVKNGFITDTSFSNIIFFDGQKWVTPSTPLLKGTKREKLLNEGKIFEIPIMKSDLKKFHYAKVINAMLDMEDGDKS